MIRIVKAGQIADLLLPADPYLRRE